MYDLASHKHRLSIIGGYDRYYNTVRYEPIVGASSLHWKPLYNIHNADVMHHNNTDQPPYYSNTSLFTTTDQQRTIIIFISKTCYAP